MDINDSFYDRSLGLVVKISTRLAAEFSIFHPFKVVLKNILDMQAKLAIGNLAEVLLI